MTMPETADAGERDAPRAGWLDRWCAVRWRAWVTWVVLARLMAYVIFETSFAYSVMHLVAENVPSFLWRYRHVGGHAAVMALFATWYEPVLLRLGTVRGAVWLTLAVAFMQMFEHLLMRSVDPRLSPLSAHVLIIAAFLVRGAAPCLALIGRRIPMVMAALAAGVWTAIQYAGYIVTVSSEAWAVWLSGLREWMIGTTAATLYAFILLYGTKLIEKPPRMAAETPRDGDV
jgi:hypothetical protein